MAYKRKLSGPILDRIDIHIHMDQLVVNKDKFLRNLSLGSRQKQERTIHMASKVAKAQLLAQERNAKWKICYNRDLKAEHMVEAFGLDNRVFLASV